VTASILYSMLIGYALGALTVTVRSLGNWRRTHEPSGMVSGTPWDVLTTPDRFLRNVQLCESCS
jgi:hypothetical protein